MFEITALTDFVIDSFDVYPMQNTIIEVYYKVGSYVSFHNQPSAWTLVGSGPVNYSSNGLVRLPLHINVPIPANSTYSFYVTSNNTIVL